MTGFELRAWREGLDLTQREAARALGCSLLTFRLWEWGRRAPENARLVTLACRHLEQHPEDIAA